MPVQGLHVRVLRLDAAGAVCIAEGTLSAQGTLDHPVVRGEGVQAGTHEVHFLVGDWWRQRQSPAQRFFQEVMVFRFEVADTQPHFDLPIKFTPWGFALFRGA